MEELPIERLLREKKEDAIDVIDDNTLDFISPDRKSSSRLVINLKTGELFVQTKLHHGSRMIDENIYLNSSILSEKFSEEQIRQIIEDISARLRQIELGKILEKIPYNFQIIEQEEDFTKFSFTLMYEKFEIYDELRNEVETILVNSFELIYGLLMKMGFFIQTSLNEFLRQPLIELKLLEIRTLLFRQKFYSKMSGRFANDQQRIAQAMKKDALNLLDLFEKEFPGIALDKLQEIRVFFEL